MEAMPIPIQLPAPAAPPAPSASVNPSNLSSDPSSPTFARQLRQAIRGDHPSQTSPGKNQAVASSPGPAPSQPGERDDSPSPASTSSDQQDSPASPPPSSKHASRPAHSSKDVPPASLNTNPFDVPAVLLAVAGLPAAPAAGPQGALSSTQVTTVAEQGSSAPKSSTQAVSQPASALSSQQLAEMIAAASRDSALPHAFPPPVDAPVSTMKQPANPSPPAPPSAATVTPEVRTAVSLKSSTTASQHSLAGLLLQIDRLQPVLPNAPADKVSTASAPNSAPQNSQLHSGAGDSAAHFANQDVAALSVEAGSLTGKAVSRSETAAVHAVSVTAIAPSEPRTEARSSPQNETEAGVSSNDTDDDPHTASASSATPLASDFLARLSAASAKADSSVSSSLSVSNPHVATPAAPTPFSATPGTSQPSTAAAQPAILANDTDNFTPTVNASQLSDAAGKSEMRVALQTDKLGAVELHAHVVGDQVGASIAVEKRDAHAVLAVELPALHQALTEKNLSVQQISLTQGALHSTAGNSGNSGGSSQQQGYTNHSSTRLPQSQWVSHEVVVSASYAARDAAAIYDAQGRLSVHA